MNANLLHHVLISLHLLAVIAWMAGLLYLPRLFVYHTSAATGSEMDQTFRTMEVRLYRGIMNPSMIAVWILGLTLVWFDSTRLWGVGFLGTVWMSAKLAGALVLTVWHQVLGRARRAFASGANRRSARFWRLTNELPIVVAAIMVAAIVTKFGDVRYGG